MFKGMLLRLVANIHGDAELVPFAVDATALPPAPPPRGLVALGRRAP